MVWVCGRHTVERDEQPDLTVGDPFADTIASALLCASEQGRVVGNAVEDLRGGWFDGTRGCDGALGVTRALCNGAH